MPTDTIPPHVRSWLYGLATTLGPLLIAYGVVDDQTWPIWLAIVGAVLGNGVALVHRPTREETPVPATFLTAPHGENPELIDGDDDR